MTDKPDKPEIIRTTITIDRDLWDAFRIESIRNKKPANTLMVELVEKFVKHQQKKGD